jgi:hypothetical protein
MARRKEMADERRVYEVHWRYERPAKKDSDADYFMGMLYVSAGDMTRAVSKAKGRVQELDAEDQTTRRPEGTPRRLVTVQELGELV